MASRKTSEDAKGSGSGAAAPIRPPRTLGQPITEPASPRDVPEPLGDLPPESVGRSDGASPNRKKKKIPSGLGDRRTSGSSKASARPRLEDRQW